MTKMNEVFTTKRRIVSAFLSGIVQEINLMELASDPYPADDDELKSLVDLSNGLVYMAHDGYEQPYWCYQIPSNEQVAELYTPALKWLDIENHVSEP